MHLHRGNLFLVGLPGAGKTTIGRHLAELLGKEFHDSDQEIEKRIGVTIPLIFEIEGEAGFRGRESSVLDESRRARPTRARDGRRRHSFDWITGACYKATGSWFTCTPRL